MRTQITLLVIIVAVACLCASIPVLGEDCVPVETTVPPSPDLCWITPPGVHDINACVLHDQPWGNHLLYADDLDDETYYYCAVTGVTAPGGWSVSAGGSYAGVIPPTNVAPGKYTIYVSLSDMQTTDNCGDPHAPETAEVTCIFNVRYYDDWKYYWFPPDTSGSGGGCGCGGDGLEPQVNARNGNVVMPSFGVGVPNGEQGALTGFLALNGCGLAVWVTLCGEVYYFSYDEGTETWTCLTDPNIKLTGPAPGEAGTATIRTPQGATHTYSVNGDETSGAGPSEVTPASGLSAAFSYEEGLVTAVKEKWGSEAGQSFTRQTLEHEDGHQGPTAIVDPDGKSRKLISYVPNHEVPYQVTLQDPDNPTDHAITTYDYLDDEGEDGTGRFQSVTLSSGVQMRVEYYPNDHLVSPGRVHWVYRFNESAVDQQHPDGTLYTQTEYVYVNYDVNNENCELDYDQGHYWVTTIRNYANANNSALAWNLDGTVDSVASSNDDHISKRYYYNENRDSTDFASALRSVREETGGGTCLSRVVYDVDVTSSSPLYRRTMSVKELELDSNDVLKEVDYEYYSPGTNYAVDPDNQYGLSGGQIVMNPQAVTYSTGSSPFSAPGNGLVKTVTTTYPSQTSYTTAVRYMVKKAHPEDPENTEAIMTPFATIARDSRGYLTAQVLNSDGTVSDVYEDNGAQTDPAQNHTLKKTKSYTYSTASDRSRGKMASQTVYDVGGTGVNQVTSYGYSYDANGSYTVTETITGGDQRKRHYNQIQQMDWEQDIPDPQNPDDDRKTFYEYDYQGRQTLITHPLITGEQSRKTSENHYSCCRLLWTRDEEDRSTYYEYDGLGRTTCIWTSIQGDDQSKTGNLVTCTYNGAFGRKDTETSFSDANTSRQTAYEYNASGQVTKIRYPYVQTEGDRLVSDESIYDDHGRLALAQSGNGSGSGVTKTAYLYDELDRVSGIDYDYQGNFELPFSTNPAADVTYTYETDTSRLTSADESMGTSSYTYDAQGSIKTYTPAVPSGFGMISYAWNSLGEKTSMTVPLGYGDVGRKIDYSYDQTGRETGVDTSYVTTTSSTTLPSADPGSTTRMVYDDARNRVRLTNKAGGVYYYVYDPTASSPAVVYEQSPTHRYFNLRKPDGSLISREKYLDGDMVDYRQYHFDGLGSVLALTNAAGTVTDKYTYDAWGDVTHTYGTIADNPYQYVGQWGYYTHYQEPDFGLLQLGVRFYDPSVGRFAQRDAMGDVLSRFPYAGDSPVVMIDPTGYQFVLPGEPPPYTTPSPPWRPLPHDPWPKGVPDPRWHQLIGYGCTSWEEASTLPELVGAGILGYCVGAVTTPEIGLVVGVVPGIPTALKGVNKYCRVCGFVYRYGDTRKPGVDTMMANQQVECIITGQNLSGTGHTWCPRPGNPRESGPPPWGDTNRPIGPPIGGGWKLY